VRPKGEANYRRFLAQASDYSVSVDERRNCLTEGNRENRDMVKKLEFNSIWACRPALKRRVCGKCVFSVLFDLNTFVALVCLFKVEIATAEAKRLRGGE
jgi:hypothetical protein